MNIVLLIDKLHSIAAGSERQIFTLIKGLVAAQHQVRLVLLRHTDFSRGLTDFPCAISCLDIYSIATWQTAKTMLAFRRDCHQQKVDVVHSYFPDACLLAPSFLSSKHLRVISSRRDMGLIYSNQPAWAYRLLAMRTHAVVANSRAVADLTVRTEALKPRQCTVIYNGIDGFLPPDNPVPTLFQRHDSIKLILVANVKPVKRTLDAVKAVHVLLQKNIAVELALVGEQQDQDYMAEINHYIYQHKLDDHIHTLGTLREPRRFLPQAHIGLLVSESEGLSNTVMEYMQAQLPVIASRVGGNPELIEHHTNGILISRGAIDELVDAIITLRDENLRVQWGAAGAQKIAAQFSIANMISQHEKIYHHHEKHA